MAHPYGPAWDAAGPLTVRVIDKTGKCPHEAGDVFEYRDPYARPEALCHAAAGALEPYLWRAALGFPSWEPGEPETYRIHCPSRTGIVLELTASTSGAADSDL
jgi:uncharacterized repeat protein (TIGR04076 family)